MTLSHTPINRVTRIYGVDEHNFYLYSLLIPLRQIAINASIHTSARCELCLSESAENIINRISLFLFLGRFRFPGIGFDVASC